MKQVVIEMSDYAYKAMIGLGYVASDFNMISAIRNGIVLPEQHGDLIDINDIQEITLEDSLHIMTYRKDGEVDCEIDAHTILEATGGK